MFILKNAAKIRYVFYIRLQEAAFPQGKRTAAEELFIRRGLHTGDLLYLCFKAKGHTHKYAGLN
jgi:hypothetical protein